MKALFLLPLHLLFITFTPLQAAQQQHTLSDNLQQQAAPAIPPHSYTSLCPSVTSWGPLVKAGIEFANQGNGAEAVPCFEGTVKTLLFKYKKNLLCAALIG